MGLTDFEVFQRIAPILAGPRQVVSWLDLARKSRVSSDDKIRRCLERLESFFGIRIVVTDNHRLKLTEVGRSFLRLVTELCSLGVREEQSAPAMTVQVDPFAEALFPPAWPSFFELWASSISVRLAPLDEVVHVRKSIAEGTTAFAVGFADAEETIPPAEMLWPKIPWVLLVPDGASFQGVISGEQLRDKRLFIPSVAAANPDVAAFLAGVPRIESDSAVAMAMARMGLAMIPDLFGHELPAGITKATIDSIPPMQLRFVLPRQGLSEPAAETLAQGIRNVVEARFAEDGVSAEEAETSPESPAEEEDIEEHPAKPKLAETAERKVSA